MEESSPSSSSCFICGVATFNRGGPRRGRRPNNFKSLKELVRRLCDLLGVVVTEEDWMYLKELEELKWQLICCENCVEILRNVDRTQEILLKAQRELKVYLDQVQSMIVQSESQNLKCSLWWRGCYDLRRNVLKKYVPGLQTSDQLPSSSSPIIQVKEEYEDNHNFDDDHHSDWDPQIDDTTYWENSSIENLAKISISHTRGAANFQLKSETEVQQDQDNWDPTTTKRGVRKRKIRVIALDDLYEGVGARDNAASTPERKRTAKINAEESLKFQYESNGDSGDDDNYIDDHNDSEYTAEVNNPNPALQSEQESEQDEEFDRQAKKKKIVKGPGQGKRHKTKGKPGYLLMCGKKSGFEPLLEADENLYLYRWDTFVRYTYTHLQCQAYKCTFQTEFDHYPSFQIMKDHLEDNHRDRRHRQRTPHPCCICNIMFKNREEFTKHLTKNHYEKLGKHAKAVCECCLTTTRKAHAAFHLFRHKNQEEQAEAINSGNYVPPRALQKKESEITEKRYVCDFEDCRMAFKSTGNLKRHKRSHLPIELRTDYTICPECGKQILREELQNHIQRVHSTPDSIFNSIPCEFCEKRFLPQDRSIYEAHIRRHKGEKPFLCPQCGNSFFDPNALRAHVKQVHEEQGPCPCPWCDHVYTKIGTLKSHMKTKHPDKCPVLPQYRRQSKFYYSQGVPEVQEGQVVYGPVQMFPCDICDVICAYKYTLKKHKANRHGIGDVKVKKPRKLYRKSELEMEAVNNSRDDEDGSRSMSSSAPEDIPSSSGGGGGVPQPVPGGNYEKYLGAFSNLISQPKMEFY